MCPISAPADAAPAVPLGSNSNEATLRNVGTFLGEAIRPAITRVALQNGAWVKANRPAMTRAYPPLVHQPVGLAQALWHDLNPPQVSDQLALKFRPISPSSRVGDPHVPFCEKWPHRKACHLEFPVLNRMLFRDTALAGTGSQSVGRLMHNQPQPNSGSPLAMDRNAADDLLT